MVGQSQGMTTSIELNDMAGPRSISGQSATEVDNPFFGVNDNSRGTHSTSAAIVSTFKPPLPPPKSRKRKRPHRDEEGASNETESTMPQNSFWNLDPHTPSADLCIGRLTAVVIFAAIVLFFGLMFSALTSVAMAAIQTQETVERNHTRAHVDSFSNFSWLSDVPHAQTAFYAAVVGSCESYGT